MKNKPIGPIGDHEIKQLKIFKTVAECEGFAAAEAKLNISRPSISNHIAALEARLNMKLCKRGRGGFSLTEEGAIVYEQTCQLLNQISKFRSAVNNLVGSPAGTLKIALTDSLATDQRCQLADIIRQFSAVAPSVKLHFDVEEMTEMENKILNNQIDIAIIPYHRKIYGIEYFHLFTDRHYLYCGEGHALFDLPEKEITREKLNQYDLVHAGLTPHMEVYKQFFDMKASAVSYFFEARIPLLLSGQYIGFLPEAYAQPYVESGQLKVIGKSIKSFPLGVAVISKVTAQPSLARDMFIDIIKKTHALNEQIPPY
ncbi:LysR family transcriptional regulator [Terasakiella brassicae]|uniref:LysR family transcriptional regulator n=1 Tax=Terasakiella brassicae TaxID=1634917 RepID=A0A917BX26_9PROT|nr:LysR family transcriptional regulator [Terasakiella brassicae]GGF60721.1 LysR family transcriptional regulator [Terasakiella brassicae]